MTPRGFRGLVPDLAKLHRPPPGLTSAATFAYFAVGGLIVLLSSALFLVAIYGHGRDYVTDPLFVRLSQTEIFLPFFPTMLAYGALAVTLGLVQPSDSRHPAVRLGAAVAFGLGTLLYLYVFWFVVENMDAGPTRLLPAYTGGFLVIASLALNAFGLPREIGERIARLPLPEPQHLREWRFFVAATRIYILGGLTLTLAAIIQSWWRGLTFWFFGARPVSGGAAVVGTIAHPTCLALGVLAVLIGLLHLRLDIQQRWQLAASVGYVLGAVLFVGALYLSARDTWQVRPDAVLVVGATLLLLSITLNAYSIIRARAKVNGTKS